MMTESVLFNLGRNMIFLREKTESLTQAESLLQPPFPGLNCLNWNVGHIATFRNRFLALLAAEPSLDPAIAQRYVPGSAPVLGDEPGLGQLAGLLRAIDVAQERLSAALPALAPARAAEVHSTGSFSMTVGEWAFFYVRHEAYHIGQLHFPFAQAMAARNHA
jgi:uncharacterized damage-inducible protein DinB